MLFRSGKRGNDAPPIHSVIIPINATGMPVNTYKSYVVCPLKNDPIDDLVGQSPNTGLKAIFADGENVPYPDLFFPAIPSVTTRLPQISINGTTLVAAGSGNLTKVSAHTGGLYNIPAGKYYVPLLSFTGDSTFTIRVDGITELVTDKLEMLGRVRFEGNGDLTIYVKGKTNARSNTETIAFSNNVVAGWVGAPEKLKIIVYNTLVRNRDLLITLDNNMDFHGSMLLQNADLSVRNNANWTGYLGTMGDKIGRASCRERV